ncbi:NUDIX domain-containing protein [Paenibacillus sp. 453mf]|uniref:NUDIX hydrolase n=1 Tax=Paenibacillus sp. 453mf TaxID=1761874 RepID=UPI0008EEA4F6|nr:NUDIX domain-containing protein [Paenibacillus sp. 453mf]SFS92332.1 8-oxo-dGTP diphosphatase [Paenibacillus sp. 453mf]
MNLISRITDYDILGERSELLHSVSRFGARGVLVDENFNIAMMHMTKRKLYKLPGGGIEGTETPEEAFLREVEEETGYRAKITHQLGRIEEHKTKNQFLQLSYCFIAKSVEENTVKLTAKEKQLGLTVIWMTMDEALKAMDRSFRNCREYSSKFMILRDKTILERAVALLRSL